MSELLFIPYWVIYSYAQPTNSAAHIRGCTVHIGPLCDQYAKAKYHYTTKTRDLYVIGVAVATGVQVLVLMLLEML